MTTLAPKYNMALNPVYQVDCSFAASGKHVAATKRRVRFRFGFSNPEAIAEGLTGTACRGEEHEVTLSWSLTSGKRLVLADGQEVHVSIGKRAETSFETSWTMNGNHTLKIVAHAAPPLRHIPGFRQFDLLLDGMSYFEMPKIYELGVKNVARQIVPSQQRSSYGYAHDDGAVAYHNYSLPERERQRYSEDERPQYYEDERRADKNPSMKQLPTTIQSPTSVVDHAESFPQDLVSDPMPVQDVQDLIDAPMALMDSINSSPNTHDEFTPVEYVEQPRNSAVVHNEILSAYGPPPSNPGMLALTNGEPVPAAYASPASSYAPAVNMPGNFGSPPPNQYGAPPQYQTTPPPQYQNGPSPQYQNAPPPQYQNAPPPQYQNAPPPQYQNAPPPQYSSSPTQQPQYTETALATPSPVVPQQLTMNQLLEEPLDDGKPVSEMDRALQNLVNIDDISVPTKTPEQRKVEEKRQAKLGKNKSVPLPPTEPSWHLGTKAALSDIKASAPAREAPSKEVMRTHAFDPRAAQAGMLVCYGAPQLSAPGFGIPAQMQQQQQQYMYAQQQYMYAQQQQQQQQQMYVGY